MPHGGGPWGGGKRDDEGHINRSGIMKKDILLGKRRKEAAENSVHNSSITRGPLSAGHPRNHSTGGGACVGGG